MLPFVAFLALAQIPQAPITVLPAAMAMPSDSADESALLLAEKVAKGGPEAGPALMAALRACGLSVVKGKDRQVLRGPAEGKGMGLALEESEVLLALNQGPNASGLAFKSLSDAYSVISKVPKDGIHQAILSSLLKGMSSPIKEVRFFSLFVDDLSAYSADPWSVRDAGNYDGQTSVIGGMGGQGAMIAGNANAQAGQIWAMEQLQTLASAMQGGRPTPELMQKIGVVQKAMAGFSGMQSLPYTIGPHGTVDIRPLADKPLSVLQAVLLTRRIYADLYGYGETLRLKAAKPMYASLAPSVPDPEAGRDNTGTILDGAATVITTLQNELVFKNAGETLAGYAEITGNITLAGAFTKLVESYNLLDMKLEPKPIELTRRKDGKPGEPKTLTYTLSIKNPNGKMNAPGRMGGWFGGVDLSGPDDGPIQGSFVNWRLDQPVDVLGSFVQFVSPGGAGDGGIQTSSKTDKDGKSTMGIQTTPQKTPLPEDAESYTRRARVIVEATLKGSNLQQDITDAFGAVVGAATAGEGSEASGGLKAVAADMISRSSLLSTRFFPVQVTDWKMPLWEGTFTATLTGGASKKLDPGTIQWIVKRTVKGRIVSALQGIPQADLFTKYGGGPYRLVLDGIKDVEIDDVAHMTGVGGGGCMGKPFPWSIDETSRGPVASMGFPYSLQGSVMQVNFVHENGQDVRKVKCTGGFNLPVRAQRVKRGFEERDDVPRPPTDWIEYGWIPVEFDTTVNGRTPSTGFRDTTQRSYPIEIDGLKGTLDCVISWELHAKKSGG